MKKNRSQKSRGTVPLNHEISQYVSFLAVNFGLPGDGSQTLPVKKPEGNIHD
jgi:hypothetical protein